MIVKWAHFFAFNFVLTHRLPNLPFALELRDISFGRVIANCKTYPTRRIPKSKFFHHDNCDDKGSFKNYIDMDLIHSQKMKTIFLQVGRDNVLSTYTVSERFYVIHERALSRSNIPQFHTIFIIINF